MDRLDQVSLEHVRLRGAGVDATVARLRLSSALGSSTLQPPAMPPSAVLVVRSMADPLPRRIADLKRAAVVNREWEHAAQNRLGELYARAARPAWGAVPTSAEAVLFADYGELLACLAADLSSSSAVAWWWWAMVRHFSLTPPGSLPLYWTRIWEQHPWYVPSALDHLSVRNQSGKVLSPLAPAQAWRLLRAMVRAFGLPDWLVPESPAEAQNPIPLHSPLPFSQAGNPEGREPPESSVGDRAPNRPSRLPWEPYVPGDSTPLTIGVEKRALLGLGLLLRRAPHVALTPAFYPHFRRWLAAQLTSVRELPRADATTLISHPISQPVTHAKNEFPRQDALEPEPMAAVAVDALAREPAQTTPSPAIPPTHRAEWEAGRLTQAGGVLYLIHLLRKMDLLRSFDTGLSGWALLELLARCLLGPYFEAVAGDPIWAVLAELDERDSGNPPGTGFQSQETYAAPRSWLAGLAPHPLSARFRSRGMELWRPEDFLVLDSCRAQMPPDTRLLPSTHSERRRRRAAAAVRPLHLPLSNELRRFLHFVLPYARWRIGKVLQGVTLQQACLRRGKLILSLSHVDLVMGMNQISVPVRLAGLDANPGWMPELGRVITFHFLAEGYNHE